MEKMSTNPECFAFLSHSEKPTLILTFLSMWGLYRNMYQPRTSRYNSQLFTLEVLPSRRHINPDLLCTTAVVQHTTTHLPVYNTTVVCAQTLVHVSGREHICCQY